MADVGYPRTKATINQALGTCVRSVHEAMKTAEILKAHLDTITDNELIAMQFDGSADVPVIRSAVADMDRLRRVFVGTETVASAYDFRTFAKLANGVGI